MRVLLHIGDAAFECPNAATAAKVADLLGSMKKVREDGFFAGRIWHTGIIEEVNPSEHRLAVNELRDDAPRFATRAAFEAHRAELEKLDEEKEGGAR